MADMGLLALMDPVSGVKGCKAAGLRLMSVEAFSPPGGPFAALLLQAHCHSSSCEPHKRLGLPDAHLYVGCRGAGMPVGHDSVRRSQAGLSMLTGDCRYG